MNCTGIGYMFAAELIPSIVRSIVHIKDIQWHIQLSQFSIG